MDKKKLENKKTFSNIGFILAAIGSAVGLGNLWYFPTRLIDYGGAAFFIPYMIALITIGLPFIILETTLGNKWRRGPMIAFKNYWKRTGPFFGGLQTMGQILIATSYVWVIGWIVIMIINAFTPQFGTSLEQFDGILGAKEVEGIESWSGAGMKEFLILLIVIIVFVLCYYVVVKGVKKGIELANKIMIPSLFILLIGFFIYACTIDGMAVGVNEIFKPDLSKLGNMSAWSMAFGQALFSLSLCSAVLIIYSAKAPKERDNVTQAIIIVSGDTLVAILGAFIVSATIGGIMTTGIDLGEDSYILRTTIKGVIDKNGTPIDGLLETAKEGVDFKVPIVEGWDSLTLINMKDGGAVVEGSENIIGAKLIFNILPVFFMKIGKSAGWKELGNIFGIFFFLSAFFAGFSSIIGQVEVGSSMLEENTRIKRSVGTLLTILTQFFAGIIFLWFQNENLMYKVTGNIFQTWILLLLAVQMTFMFAFKPKAVHDLAVFNNRRSKIKLNKIFAHIMICISAAVMVFIVVAGLYGDISSPEPELEKITTFQWIVVTFSYWVPVFGWTLGILWYKKKTGYENKHLDY